MKRHSWLLPLIILFASALPGQRYIEIQGKVLLVGSEAQPLDGVVIGTEAGVELAVSAPDGTFELRLPTEQTGRFIRLFTSKTGYLNIEGDSLQYWVIPRKGKTHALTVSMAPRIAFQQQLNNYQQQLKSSLTRQYRSRMKAASERAAVPSESFDYWQAQKGNYIRANKVLTIRAGSTAAILLKSESIILPRRVQLARDSLLENSYTGVLEMLPTDTLEQWERQSSAVPTTLHLESVILGYFLRGEALLHAYRFEDAVTEYRKLKDILSRITSDPNELKDFIPYYRNIALLGDLLPVALLLDFQQQEMELRKTLFSPFDLLSTSAMQKQAQDLLRAERYQEALTLQLEVLDLRQKFLPAGDRMIGFSHYFLGPIYRAMGNIEAALDAYRTADRIFVATNTNTLNWNLVRPSSILYELSEKYGIQLYLKGSPEQALPLLEVYTDCPLPSRGDSILLAGRLKNVATVRQSLGQYEAAIPFLEQSLALASALDSNGVYFVAAKKPEIYDSLGYDRFRQWAMHSFWYGRDRFMPALLTELPYQLALCYQQTGRNTEAKKMAETAYREAVMSQDDWIIDQLQSRGLTNDRASSGITTERDPGQYLQGFWLGKGLNQDTLVYWYNLEEGNAYLVYHSNPDPRNFPLKKLYQHSIRYEPNEGIYYAHRSEHYAGSEWYSIRPAQVGTVTMRGLFTKWLGLSESMTNLSVVLGTEDELAQRLWLAKKQIEVISRLTAEMHSEQDRVINQENLVLLLEQALAGRPENTTLQSYVAEAYGRLSWYRLLARQFEAAEDAASRGLAKDEQLKEASINLTLSLLLQGKLSKAQQIYNRRRALPFDDTRNWEVVFRESISALQERGIDHPDSRRLLE